MDEDLKKCSKCKTISSKSDFHKDRTKNDGYRPTCKFCCKNYYYDNQDRTLNNHKIYNKNNRSKINSCGRLKRKTDFSFNIFCYTRRRTIKAFKSQNIEKTNQTNDLIGCSNSFLRKWIIHQIYGNMTIENYGKIWCLDHCYPLSKTKLSNGYDMKRCFNWINLRPMYVRENIIKGDKIDH